MVAHREQTHCQWRVRQQTDALLVAALCKAAVKGAAQQAATWIICTQIQYMGRRATE